MEDTDKESCVVRIVYLDDSFTETALKSLILTKCQPQGNIIKIYLKRNDEPNIFFGYIIFEHSYDASKTVALLNGYVHISNKFEVELIGPNLAYRKYIEPQRRTNLGLLQRKIQFPNRRYEAFRSELRKRQLFSERLGRTYLHPNGKTNAIGHSTNPGISKYVPPNLRILGVQNNFAYDEKP